MAVTNNDGMYSYLDQLSTQELEDLLQKDMETADGGDPDMVMCILEVIENVKAVPTRKLLLPH